MSSIQRRLPRLAGGDRQRIRDCALDRVPLSSLRQSQAGGCLCWPRADALAEWVNRSRAGVSKAGNPRLRAMLLQLAWLWLRHQPDSVLSQWFLDRVKANGGRRSLPLLASFSSLFGSMLPPESSSRGRLSEPRDCQFRRSHQKFARVRLPGGSRWMNR